MDKKLKAKWVKALRSGDYKQTTGYLSLNGGYCCLGVLCAVAGYQSSSIRFIESPLGEYTVLDGDVQRALSSLNDKKIPFEVIAGLIQEAL